MLVLLGCILLLTSGCVVLTGVDGQELEVNRNSSGDMVLFAAGEGTILKALVKGSIYESGETVSVFGTCLDADDHVINDTYAKFSAWYPNGTLLFTNVTMSEIQQGYYIYTGSMNAVQGTYLTELTCHLNGTDQIARAFGEWQNPFWVSRINATQAAVANVSQQIDNLSQNITISIGALQVNMTESFEITWDKIESVNTTINNTFYNLSEQITVVGQIANGSVDRNDSYLAELLLLIHGSLGIPSNGTITVEEYPDRVRYGRSWDLQVIATNEYGVYVGYPDVSCYTNTSITTTPVEMQPGYCTTDGEWLAGASGTSLNSVDCFQYTESKITDVEEFAWTVNCTYS